MNIFGFRSFCALIVVCITLTGCGSSSSTAPTESDSNSAQTENDLNQTLKLDHIVLISEGDTINVDPGAVKIVPVIAPGNDVSLSLLTIENAPAWVTVDDEYRLNIAPEQAVVGGVEIPFQINYTLSNTEDQIQVQRLNASVSVSLTTVLVSGTMPMTGGEIANDWLDIMFSSEGGLENSYELSMILIEKGPSAYSFAIESTPTMSENDIAKIKLEHAPHEELYLNYKNAAAFADRAEPDNLWLRTGARKADRVIGDSKFTVPSVCSNLKYDETNVEELQDDYRLSHIWWGSEGVFVDNADIESFKGEDGGEPRVLPSFEPKVTEGFDSYFDSINVSIECAVALQSTVSSMDSAGLSGREPVLLVHGFDTTGKLGGRDEYFGKLPGMLQDLKIGGRRFLPMVFRWQTNARFEVVADELKAALVLIYGSTGKKVHIVAHSFGGTLTRTMLQGIAMESEGAPLSKERLERIVASVTTVGTPHSGIFDSTVEYNDGSQSWTFNRGFGNNFVGRVSRWCGSINCHQLGEIYAPTIFSITLASLAEQRAMRDYIGLNDQKVGKLAFQLASTYPDAYPNIPTNVLIGARLKSSGASALAIAAGAPTSELATEDGLISSYGQLWKAQTYRQLQSNIEGKPVTERYLGNSFLLPADFDAERFDDSFRHNTSDVDTTDFDGGYNHRSAKFNSRNQSEVGFERCSANDPANCRHAGWHHLVDILTKNGAQSEEIETPPTILISGQLEADSSAIADIYVSVTDPTGQGVSTLSDQNGAFSVAMPFTANSTLTVAVVPNRSSTEVIVTGLRAETRTLTTNAALEESSGDIGVIQLYDRRVTLGSLLLSVNDAFSAIALNNFEYRISNTANITVARGISDTLFSAEHLLPYDTYRIEIEKDGYKGKFGFVCELNSEQTPCTATIEPLVSGESGGSTDPRVLYGNAQLSLTGNRVVQSRGFGYNGELLRVFRYEYKDSENRIDTFLEVVGEEELFLQSAYYDSNGKVISIDTYQNSLETYNRKISYDSNGFVTEVSGQYMNDTRFKTVEKYRYDNQNRLTSFEQTRNVGLSNELLFMVMRFEYDGTKLTKKINSNTDGQFVHYEYTTDSNGRLSGHVVTDASPATIYDSTRTYKWSDDDDLLSHTKFHEEQYPEKMHRWEHSYVLNDSNSVVPNYVNWQFFVRLSDTAP